MRIIENLAEMVETARGWLLGGTVGCVIIIGPVQAEHITLIRAAREKSEICVVCILQAGWLIAEKREPYEASTYGSSRFLEDLEIASNLGVDVVFLPRRQDLYPQDFATSVVPGVEYLKENGSTWGNGSAFATLMVKLYHLLHPDVLYFEQRDMGYVAILRQLVRDLHLELDIVILPTGSEVAADNLI